MENKPQPRNVNALLPPVFRALPGGGHFEIAAKATCEECGVPIRCHDAELTASGGFILLCRNGHFHTSFEPGR